MPRVVKGCQIETRIFLFAFRYIVHGKHCFSLLSAEKKHWRKGTLFDQNAVHIYDFSCGIYASNDIVMPMLPKDEPSDN